MSGDPYVVTSTDGGRSWSWDCTTCPAMSQANVEHRSLAEAHATLHVRTHEGPEDGHTFRIGFELRGSSKVVGDPVHTDDKEFMGGRRTVEVRAWNLPDALRKAADLPLIAWFPELDDVPPPLAAPKRRQPLVPVVTAIEEGDHRRLTLSCGHTVVRRAYMGGSYARARCPVCPPLP